VKQVLTDERMFADEFWNAACWQTGRRTHRILSAMAESVGVALVRHARVPQGIVRRVSTRLSSEGRLGVGSGGILEPALDQLLHTDGTLAGRRVGSIPLSAHL
jgi:hypothetical protein